MFNQIEMTPPASLWPYLLLKGYDAIASKFKKENSTKTVHNMIDIARCMDAGAGICGGETCVRSVFSMFFF